MLWEWANETAYHTAIPIAINQTGLNRRTEPGNVSGTEANSIVRGALGVVAFVESIDLPR